MRYRYVKLPLLGSVYVEYNKDNSSMCGWERERGELFLYIRKVRVIYTPPSWRHNGQTNGTGNGEAGSTITNPESDREVSRFRPRDTNTNRGSISDCG